MRNTAQYLLECYLTEMKVIVLLKILLKKVKKDVIIVYMKSRTSVTKPKAEFLPIPETIRRIFGTVETPSVLSDEQSKTQKTISHRAKKELLDFTKALQKIDPKGKEVKYEQHDGIDFYLYNLQRTTQKSRRQ